MKKLIAFTIVSVFSLGTAGALELASSFTVGNLFFDTSEDASLGAAGGSFEEAWAFGTSLSASERIGENVSFAAGFERDTVLRNTIFTRVGFDAGFARLTVGPFFGPFNVDGSALSSGISTSLRLERPGIVFGSFRSDSTIGAGLAAPGDYVQERSEIVVGFWVPNILLSARVSSESFTYKEASDLTTVDERTRYEFVADTFKKNVPYTVRINMGYMNLKRSYVGPTSATSFEDELGAAVIGFQAGLQVTSAIRVTAGAEGALYAWGIGDMGSPSTSTALFTAQIGLTVTLPAGDTGAAPAEEAK